MDRELKRLESYKQNNAGNDNDNNDLDREYDEQRNTGLKSAIVVKSEQENEEKGADEIGLAAEDEGRNNVPEDSEKSGAEDENGGTK
jgi:hypothetical protein